MADSEKEGETGEQREEEKEEEEAVRGRGVPKERSFAPTRSRPRATGRRPRFPWRAGTLLL